jgi:hypothetical protein
LAFLVTLALSVPAYAQDPGRWKETGHSWVPKDYYQGITSDGDGHMYFAGPFMGLYRTDMRLAETIRNRFAIPADVRNGVGYNHIGALAFDHADGGRLLLPLGCSHPKAGGNTCGKGAIGVADPGTLTWRYAVDLDPAYIQHVPWVAVSPDGSLAWTSAGNELLAYSIADINLANAATHALLRPVRRIARGAPPSGITGAAFLDGHLVAATMKQRRQGGPFQLWSIDLPSGARRLEVERTIVGESEGVEVVPALGGLLHWQIMPYNPQGLPPTYGTGRGTILHFAPTARYSRPKRCSWIRSGTTADDAIRGTAEGDILSGAAGNDSIRAFSGADCLLGGPGRDRLAAGAGRDKLIGGPGGDTLIGGSGDDMAFGGPGSDRIDGSAGADKLFGSVGNDVLRGGPGADKLVGGPGNDVFYTRDGRKDVVQCSSGRDVAFADARDRLVNCEIKRVR